MNQADALTDRLGLMLENGLAGLALVFLLLAVFLELRLAFWVSLGIPVSFLGTFMLMPVLDVIANIVSTFAFIMVLGIVVDDTIVGENVYRHQRRGRAPIEGALARVREMATPALFAVLTTAAAFSPLLFGPGMLGKMMRYVPLVVIPRVLFSLVARWTASGRSASGACSWCLPSAASSGPMSHTLRPSANQTAT